MGRARGKIFIVVLFVGLLWLKTNYVQTEVFDLEIENEMQQFILDINPVSSILLFLGIGLLFKRWGLVISYFICTVILYANVLYYRELNDFITIPVLSQGENVGDLAGSFKEILKGYDIFFWLDLIVFATLVFLVSKKNKIVWKPRQGMFFVSLSALVFLINMGLAEIERPDLLSRTFDRAILVRSIGLYNYHLYDGVLESRSNAQRAMATDNEIVPVYNYIKDKQVESNQNLFGSGSKKNVIVVSLESMQTFVLDKKINGEEITPFMNKLKNESYYFENFYHQVGQGRTSDSEFLLENSLYPLDRGSVFFTNGENEYYALPKVLKEQGYYTSVQHSNNSSFWNRNVVYDSFGYDYFYDENSYDITPENSIGWGLKDKEFFEQSVEHMTEMRQPFYTKLITLTNHYPFVLDDEDASIDKGEYPSQTLNRYFQTVRYMDEALELFVNQLKENGLYDNSILIVYGDHFGISENHNRSVGMFLEKEINEYESLQLQRTPMFIHIPGESNNEIVKKVSGQIDIRPTILNILGIKDPNPIVFGSDMFENEKDSLVVQRDGSFATDEYLYSNGKCFDRGSGTEIEQSLCEPYVEKAKVELTLSNQVIQGDLLRFLNKVKE